MSFPTSLNEPVCDEVPALKKPDTETSDIANVEGVRNGSESNDCCAVQKTDVQTPVEKAVEHERKGKENVCGAGVINSDNESSLKNVDKKDENQLELEDPLTHDKLETISIYFKLVKNQKNHSMLVKESSVMGFLLLCLGDEATEVVEKSFEVFRILSKCQENLVVLESLEYIMDALRCVSRNTHVKADVRQEAKNLIAALKNTHVKADVRQEAKNLIAALKSVSSKDHAPLSELSESKMNVMVTKATAVECKDSVKKSADLNTTMSTMKRKNKGKETILYVDNGVLQQKSERTKITQALISVPGIISVTYDVKNNFCVVRGKRSVASEVFGRAVAVATQGLGDVYLIRKNEKKEEVKVPITCNGKENMTCALPPYPEELENEDIDDSAAVARTDQDPTNDASFFKSAKNFIKRSFYW